MNKGAVQQSGKSTDERDLDVIKVVTYIFACIPALYALLVLFGIGTLLFTAPGEWMGLFFLLPLFAGSAFYAYINYASARALGQRRDAHLSYFVAGMNTMAFPLGTILSFFTWRVLSRPSVRDLYEYQAKYGATPLPPVAPALSKESRATAKRQAKIIAMPDEMPAASIIAHVDEEEERLWQEMEKRAKEGEAAET